MAAETHQTRKDWTGGRCPFCCLLPSCGDSGLCKWSVSEGTEEERAPSAAEREVEGQDQKSWQRPGRAGARPLAPSSPSVPGTVVGQESERGLKWLCISLCEETGGLLVSLEFALRISSRGMGKVVNILSHLVKEGHFLSDQRGSEQAIQRYPTWYRIPRVPTQDPRGVAPSARLRQTLLPGAGQHSTTLPLV